MNMFAPGAKGKPRTGVERGGTGKTTVAEARAALDVPGLDADNTFTGENTFTSAQTHITGTLVVGSVLPTNSLRLPSGSVLTDGVTETRTYTFPDANGDVLLDAPSDGKYYVRKDGAWVEIVP